MLRMSLVSWSSLLVFSVLSLSPVRVRALPCAVEDELSDAASRLIALGRVPESVDVERAVRAAGSDAVNVRARFGPSGDGAGMKAWLAKLQATADAPLVCGQSAGERGQIVLVSARAGKLIPPGKQHRVIKGELASGFDHAQVVVTQSAGELSAFEVDARELAEGFELPDELDRVTRVQLVARGPSGPRPVAERLWVNSPEALPETDTQLSDALSPAEQLGELREIHRVGQVRSNRLLNDVADAHAKAVCRSARVAHTLAPDSDPEARLRAAGIEARVVGETVARSTSVANAYRSLMRSASHRLTLLDRRFTEAGIATAQSGDHVCLVVLLAAWPRYAGR